MAENINLFLTAFDKVKETAPNQYICRCPAHADKKSSLSISYDPNEDTIALHCHAGCSTADILTEVGKTWADVMPTKEDEPIKPLKRWQINLVAEYRYTDADGNYLYSKLRYEGDGIDGKEIRYGRIIDGEYIKGKGGAGSELYNVTAIKDAIKDNKTVFIVEGEKDVETLRSIGLVAVTAGGTSDWQKRFAKHFAGAHDVVILADNDAPGQNLAEKIVKDLGDTVFVIKTITPSAVKHGDVTDWLQNEEGTRDKLLDVVRSTDPVYATWARGKDNKPKINPSLLADTVLSQHDIIIARNPGTNSDQVLWYKGGVYHVCSGAEVQSEVDNYLPSWISTPSILRQAEQMIIVRAKAVKYDEVNADERYINVRNGLIDTESFKLVPHTPTLLSTVQLACEYDPYAKAPTWRQFKRDYCKDEDGIVDEEMLRLDRMKAGLILSSIYGYRLKGAFVQYSAEGNTGKSVDCDILTYLLGKDNTANVSFQDMSNDRWATGRCWGKRLVVVGDQGKESIRDSSTFKQLTGGDTISGEMKGIQHFQFRFRGVILVSCNHLPVFEDDKGDHMSERLNFIHSRNVIEEEDRDVYLRDKLEAEASGILNWALDGLKDFKANGNRLCKCSSSEALMNEYRCRYDTFYLFIHEYCEITKDKSSYIKKSELEDEYERYCTANDLTAIYKRNIKDRAASHGIPLKNLHGVLVYRGVRFKYQEREADAEATGFTPMQEAIPF
jgi:P4 family phage/plasmid primase-like protien